MKISMSLKIRLTAVFLIFSLPNFAHAALSDLQSYPTWVAVEACRVATFGCATKYEVQAGHHNHIESSCHYVNKAVDVYGSNACLNAFALCLAAQVVNPVLYCYKNWGIGGMINWVDSGKCVPGDHQTHVHVQPLFGCHGQSNE